MAAQSAEVVVLRDDKERHPAAGQLDVYALTGVRGRGALSTLAILVRNSIERARLARTLRPRI